MLWGLDFFALALYLDKDDGQRQYCYYATNALPFRRRYAEKCVKSGAKLCSRIRDQSKPGAEYDPDE